MSSKIILSVIIFVVITTRFPSNISIIIAKSMAIIITTTTTIFSLSSRRWRQYTVLLLIHSRQRDVCRFPFATYTDTSVDFASSYSYARYYHY